jgi:hypothetical protein
VYGDKRQGIHNPALNVAAKTGTKKRKAGPKYFGLKHLWNYLSAVHVSTGIDVINNHI